MHARRDKYQCRDTVEAWQEGEKEMIMKDTKENREMLDALLDPGGELGAELDAGHLGDPMGLITLGRIICRSLDACSESEKAEIRGSLYRHYGLSHKEDS